jgi:D-aminoacyl-tRNA deacylase
MKVIIISKTDTASCNIFENLMKLRDWRKEGAFQGNPLYFHEEYCIGTINDEHIFHDNVDTELSDVLKEKGEPECIIYASRHRSESGKRSLTVHPVGNFDKAEFGGRLKTLVPASPHLMTQALCILKTKAKAKELDYAVSFEATHHGPYLQTPTFFIEIGSEEKAWQNEEAGSVIAETILDTQAKSYPVGIGVGGGHYAPRITDVALERRISFGHIVPTYALAYFTPEMAEQVVRATNGVKKVYFHKKRMRGGQYSKWKEFFLSLGIEPVKSADLKPIFEK